MISSIIHGTCFIVLTFFVEFLIEGWMNVWNSAHYYIYIYENGFFQLRIFSRKERCKNMWEVSSAWKHEENRSNKGVVGQIEKSSNNKNEKRTHKNVVFFQLGNFPWKERRKKIWWVLTVWKYKERGSR
jgi:hypothetical protein